MPEREADMLPAAVVADRKVTQYLLNAHHSEGGPKAGYFIACGFSPNAPRPFIEALQHGEAENLVSTMRSEFAVKYVCEGPLPAPNRVIPRVRSVWQKKPGDIWRFLVTAYPF